MTMHGTADYEGAAREARQLGQWLRNLSVILDLDAEADPLTVEVPPAAVAPLGAELIALADRLRSALAVTPGLLDAVTTSPGA